MWDGHLESRKNPDRLKRSIHVDRIGVHSTFVYIYAGLRVLKIWANCLFSFNMSFLLRKVEDVMTISKSQSLTSVSIKDCTLRVQNETNTYYIISFTSNNKSNLHSYAYTHTHKPTRTHPHPQTYIYIYISHIICSIGSRRKKIVMLRKELFSLRDHVYLTRRSQTLSSAH